MAARYTEQDVLDAGFASETDEYARANECTADSALIEFATTAAGLLADRERYARGKAVLATARLVASHRTRDDASLDLELQKLGQRKPEAVARVLAGHIATSPAYRWLGLVRS